MRMLFFPIEFGELTIDDLTDTGALTSAISEAITKKHLLAPQRILNEGPPPSFQILKANGHLGTPGPTVHSQFELGDILFKERFIVMNMLKKPLIGCFSYEKTAPFKTCVKEYSIFLSFPCNSSMQTSRTLTISNLY